MPSERRSLPEYVVEYSKLTEAAGVVVGLAMMVLGAIVTPIVPAAIIAGGAIAGGSAAMYIVDEKVEDWFRKRRERQRGTIYQRQPASV